MKIPGVQSSRQIAGAALRLTLCLMISSTTMLAQTCSLPSCPINNNCPAQSTFGDACPNPVGSDPVCTYANPDPCRYTGDGCSAGNVFDGSCCSHTSSPIILDLTGRGFRLSNPEGGVWFRVFPNIARKIQVAWPIAGSGNGWLVLDRNENGIIDDFGEFFGNETNQPAPLAGQQRNGFAALAVYDRPDQGGNGDGRISKEDAIYGKLRVWVDENHDGISQPAELHTLDSLDIASIDLQYKEVKKVDEFGNIFRFRSSVRDSAGGETNKVTYDVYLTLGSSQPDETTANWFLGSPNVGFVVENDPPKI
jgi:hypothetical protein